MTKMHKPHGGRSRFSSKSKFSSNNRTRRRPRTSPSIDITRFINKAQEAPAQPEENVVTRPFAELPLHKDLLTSIERRGFATPTPIQDQAIEQVLQGHDLLGIANTGTGKTGAFLLPILHLLLGNRNQKALILAPTRELALQIDTEFKKFAKKLDFYSALCIGGTSMHQQHKMLSRRFNIVIGTPGRVKDLVDRRRLDISKFDLIVLDEVDRMLDMGFVNDVREILDQTSKKKQSLFFSATMSPQIKKLIDDFSKDIKTISVKSVETASTIDQDIVEFGHPSEKLDILHDILIKDEVAKVLIFGRTKRNVQDLSEKLIKRGFKSASIHGNKTQAQRQQALSKFRNDKITMLVATDVAARGLDIQDVTHVINYDIPESYEDYVHRIGRTGRANKKGQALTFVQKKISHDNRPQRPHHQKRKPAFKK
ncbi:DEAD/DEAH box helicase [bacterium]|mgnify:FL=1|jgi:ATP-dependent RNA helicase RhlE|nr:DEAD/DEAH box helicase [bacterium]MBT5015502.1 DEAD/DEAH box helicase [bacterium]